MTTRSASDPWLDGVPPHVPARAGELPGVCLLPGDPARVELSASVLTDFSLLGTNREFTIGVGIFAGQELAVCSTGIGGPSAEIAVVELARLGVHTVIRVGGMGAVRSTIVPGQLTSAARALRGGGTARFYAPENRPIEASPVVAHALERAAMEHGEYLISIAVVSCDSYYLGEGRPLPGLEAQAAMRLAEVEALGADAMDMECETVFAVARAMGLKYGGLLATRGNRATDEWLDDYEPVQLRMLTVAAAAGASLSS
jgi:uridine phosphorylase